MSQDNMIQFECPDCHRMNYFSNKNKRKLHGQRLALSKYCKECRHHTVHKETKK